MTTNQKAVSAALYKLISQKDPDVFKSIEKFEQSIVQTAAISVCPESEAVKAGLKERFPWVMQSESTGTVSRATAQNLKKLLIKKYSTAEATADWAVKCWAKALHLKIEGTQTQSVNSESPRLPNRPKNRIGITYAVDSRQNFKIFDCWYGSASEKETTGLATSPQICEASVNNDTFTDLAKNPANSASTIRTAAKSTSSKPSKASSPTNITKPNKTVKAGPPTSPKPSNANATELYNQAIEILAKKGKKLTLAKAHSLLNQATNLGSIQAHRTLGQLYLQGLGTPTDFNQAADHLSLAAEKGDADAQFHLASLYQCGMGVEFNIQKAIYWLQKAITQGHPKSATLMQEILDDMNNS